MSTTIDQRVVEMRFDNRQFETNVQTSMSTLDKLKQRLNLTGASKGLENLNSAAKNVNMGALGTAVESVHAKFSALEVMGVTALANITNSAVNAGKRMIKALTLDPVMSGFQEYETQMNSVQTILANTQSKGSTLDDVNKALDTLNEYADQTIYNFTEMTRNIGTFTAAGVDLQTSVDSIKGIANLAAVSGSSSQQASTAMYQLSQALAAGKVSLMDWNSVVNAGMGGELFQNALIRTSELLKTGAKDAINTYGSFRESLTKGEWLTTEVLTETLKQLSGAYTEAELINQGFTKEQAAEIMQLAKTAESAATEVKTFSQLWDVLKESAQSGWAQTWKLIIGDFEQAKALLSPLAKFFTGIIDGISDARNKLLEGALGKTFSGLSEKISSVMKPLKGTADAVEKVTETVKDYSKVVDEIINGDWGKGQERWDKLTKAGYDWAHAQNLVNEKLGDGTRHATKYKEAQNGVNEAQKSSSETQSELSGTEAKRIAQLAEMSDEQLRSLGYTEEQISAFRELKDTADKLGIPLEDFIKNIDQINGRWLLINSFKNAGQGLITVFKAIRDAWVNAFPPMTSNQLFDIIAAIHKFSTHLVVSKETADNLTRTLKGVFAILDIITTFVGGGFKIAFKVVSTLLEYFDTNLLEVTATIGDAIVGFRDWLDSTLDFTKVLDVIVPAVKKVAETIRDWINAFMDLPKVQQAINFVKDAISGLKDVDLLEVGKNIVDGLVNGLGDGVKRVVETVINLGKSLLSGICEVLGIHSPSTEMYEVGQNAITGLINSLKNGISKIVEVVKTIASKIVETIRNVDWSSIFAGIISIATLSIIKKLVGVFEAFASPLEGLGDMFEGFGKALKSLSFNLKAKAIKNIAISLAILVGAIAVLSFLDADKLWESVKIVGVLAAILAGLAIVVEGLAALSSKFGSGSKDFTKLSILLVGMSASLLLLGFTVKQISTLNPEQAKQGFIGLAGLIVAIAVALAAYGLLVKGDTAKNIDKAGKMLVKMSIAMLIMVGVVKLVGKLSPDEMKKGAIAMAAFGVFVIALAGASRLAGGSVNKLGGMLVKMSIAMLLLIGVVKLIGLLSPDEMKKGAAAMGAFVIFVGLLGLATRTAGSSVPKLGGMLVKMSIAMLLMVGIVKLISGMSAGDLIKGGIAIAAFIGIVYLLIKVVKTAGPNAPKIAGTLLAMSVAIGILAGIAILLGMINLGNLAKGLVAVGILGSIMALMIYATKGANDCKGNLIVMSIAIAVMATAVAALSVIDGSKLAGATLAVSTLIGMFALLAKSSSTIQSGIGPLIVITIAVGLLGGILYALSQLPIESTLGAAASLSLLLMSLSVAISILGKPMFVSPNTLLAVTMMTIVIGILGGILYLLRDLPVESTLANAVSLSLLLLSLSGACLILSAVGATGPAAFIGVGALMTLIISVGGLMAAIGALATHYPKLGEFLDAGLPILEKIGYGLGSFFGNIIGGFSAGVTSGLPEIATNMSTFMTNLQPFIDGAKGIGEDSLTGVRNLAEMMLLLAGANLAEGISSFLTGSSSMETFSAQLSQFADAIVAFSNKVKGKLDEESLMAAANAGKMLAEMQSMIAGTGGVFQFFTGEKDIGAFGAQMLAFGDAIVQFSRKVSGGVDEGAVTAAASAGSIMAEMQSKIVPTGGVFQFFTGEKNMSEFGVQLVMFGNAITQFSAKVAGNIDEGAVTAAANAGAIMAEMQGKLIASGGVVQFFTGEKDMAKFGLQLVAFGDAITQFSEKVAGNIDETAITAAANAGALMTEMQAKIVPTGGVFSFFTGDKDLSKFGGQLVAFGEAIVGFSEKVAGNIDESSVTAAANAGSILAKLQANLPEDKWFDGKMNLEDFAKQMIKFGEGIADYSDSIAEVDTGAVSKSITAAERMLSLINETANIDSSGISTFKEAINDLADTNLDGFIETFSKSASKVISAGANLVESLVKGIKSKESNLGNAAKSLLSSFTKGIESQKNVSFKLVNNLVSDMLKAVNKSRNNFMNAGKETIARFTLGIESGRAKVLSMLHGMLASTVASLSAFYTGFYNAGSYLATGFANGISANAYKASAKATAMATAAKKAAEKALGIKSPAKEFYKIGDFAGLGFVNALGDYGRKVYHSAYDMADSAKSGLSEAISNIQRFINGDMDMQPTIRPVLDLSAVASGASSINGMFSRNFSIGALANVDAISSMSEQNRQNGGFDDVVSAINKLRKDLGNVGNSTYNINGIAYDDGTNVSDAIKLLVRAAKVERRI